ncbi:GlxA family transcriptional regulator [Sciscionella sediminilitoris]|uniref:GlxA family transcriptional regulator n=1 Tax=Sciscionella sediminilitoris TaxID=1445613 RepID=UPI0004DF7367|nr:helix-turn-helix domain-containing protein [Sciscionella sp. SE31]
MSEFTGSGPHRVAVLARPGLIPFELATAHRVFGRARDAAGAPLYEVRTCARVPGRVRTDADFDITAEHGPELLAEADTVIIPATHDPDQTETTGRLDPWLAEAFALIRPHARIASVCTGAFVLAAAGLLDGAEATTHWMAAERFRALYPAVHLDPDVLYTDNGRVLTSAGDASGIDLCLHMIRCDHGAAIANEVARAIVMPPHRDGGQAQFIRRPAPDPRDSSTMAARSWALRHLDRPLSLRELAECEAMSVRTFTRRFRAEVGLSPARWLLAQRLDRARTLLEETDLAVDKVAAESGFGTAASLRQHLHASLGVSPSAYRATFREPAL